MSEVFPFRPDWASRVLERLEWLTDVIEAHDWTEERIALRSLPRRYLEYSFLLTGHAAARLDALLWRWQAEQFILPIWTDPQRVGALSSAATTIPATTAGYDFEDGGQAVLWGSDDSHEVVQIDTVGASDLTLSAGLANDWPAGTLLYPARLARAADTVSVQRMTAGTLRAGIRFEVEPSAYAAAAAANQYQGVDVFERRPNWASFLPLEYRRKAQRLDYALGDIAVDDHGGIPATIRNYQTLLRNRTEIADWRGFLHARQGRYAPLWAYSWTQDIVQAQAIGSSDTTLAVKAMDAENRYQLEQGRQDIALRHKPTGTWYRRRITDVTAGDPGEEVITIDSSLGVAAAAGELDPISWLTLSRLEADAVEIAWLTAGVAESSLQLRSVRA
jgi:hypothetical protein